MRLDKFLYFARLTKTRALAQAIIAQGRVRINRIPVPRGSAEVTAGDVVTLPLHDRIRVILVISLPHRRGPAAEAHATYDDLSPSSD
jgi:ribosome-associated heat shock protein Hsp15